MARPTDIVFMRFKSAGFADLRRPILAGVGLALGMSAAAPALAAVDGQAAEPQQPTTVASSHTPLEGPTPVAEPAGQAWAVHGQATFVTQGNLGFHSPYRGKNSLDPAARGRETVDVTLFAGLRLWPGAEVWINPEIDQGFGLSNTLGAAGFPSGEAYKVGRSKPYFKLQRLFVRQTIDLGGERETVEADQNQLAGSRTADRLVITAGKFGVPDVFDTNQYAHDPRGDFLNWSTIEAGSFDYAADAWGYTIGAAAEWYVGRWTVRGGLFDLSDVPNSEHLDKHFDQGQGVAEIEKRHTFRGRPGKVKVTAFLSRARMGSFDDAVRLAQASGQPADTAAVRRYRSRSGISINLEQQLRDDLGVFARAGFADGDVEPFDFSDIDRTVSAGLSLKGAKWGRPDDTIGLAGVVNGITGAHERYFAAGGAGILVGDGRLPNAGTEQILEGYYDVAVAKGAHVSLDGQLINNPGYNRDRGPVAVFAVRLHGQF